jgi:hypothetical protein
VDSKKTDNKALHLTAFPLHSKAAGEFESLAAQPQEGK